MRHLSPEDFVDLLDGAQPESAFSHLDGCDRCRQQLAELRQSIAASLDAAVPEPSPLFWDHLSARIRAAVDADVPPAAPASGWSRLTWRYAALAATVALAVAAGLAPRFLTRSAVNPTPAGVVPTPLETHSAGLTSAELPFSFVADLAATLDWESAAQAGLTTGVGTVDQTLSELSSDESLELKRLLNEALKKSGPNGV
jgi:hypothetical protein